MKKSQKVIFWIMILLVGGLGGLIADRYFFPYLSSTSFFSKYDFLKRSTEDVTVINKTEQVFIKEENTVNKTTGKVSSSLVKIISYQKNSSQKIQTTKEGMGAVVTSDGLILAVSSNIDTQKDTLYKIIFNDGARFDGEFFATDSFSELSFIKINAANLNTVSFANSDDIKAGEKIVAFGKNHGKQFIALSSGLIKGFENSYNLSGKTISSSEKMEGVYKTDINFDSNFDGGLITDFASQVVGIVESLEKNGQIEYFAIPSNEVKKVIEKAINNQLETAPVLGIYYISLNKDYAEINNLPVTEGALIYTPSLNPGLAIIANSAAAKAGLKLNDIITKINDQAINANKPLSNVLYSYKKGESINITILRNSEEITKNIIL